MAEEEANGSFSIADMLREAAAEAERDSGIPAGFSFVEEYGMYYSAETGYYFDQKTNLYYHLQTQTYYYYDHADAQYKIYSAPRQLQWSKRAYRRKATGMFGEEAIKTMNQEDVDVFETVFSMFDQLALDEPRKRAKNGEGAETADGKEESEAPARKVRRRERRKKIEEKQHEREMARAVYEDGEIIEIFSNVMPRDVVHEEEMREEEEGNLSERSSSSRSSEESVEREGEEEDERLTMMREEGFDQPPCVRLIEEPSHALHIITMIGGKIGTFEQSDVRLADMTLPNCAAEVRYREEEGDYVLRVLSGGAKCTVDGKRIKKGEELALEHAVSLRFGDDISFAVHIHSGRNTCPGCEPGLLMETSGNQAEMMTTAEIRPARRGEAARRAQLRELKKSYGLDLEQPSTSDGRDYTDRARLRRATVGSVPADTQRDRARVTTKSKGGMYDNCDAKPVPGAAPLTTRVEAAASATRALSQENKGFKLLKAMGWSEGSGLGRKEDGRVEPVATEQRAARAGLGIGGGGGLGGEATKKAALDPRKDAILQKTRERYEQSDYLQAIVCSLCADAQRQFDRGAEGSRSSRELWKCTCTNREDVLIRSTPLMADRTGQPSS